MMTLYDALVAVAFLLAVVVLGVVQAWLAYRINRGLQKENFRLLQCNLALSEKPLAFPMAQEAERTRVKEIESERDQAVAANGHAPGFGPRSRMQS